LGGCRLRWRRGRGLRLRRRGSGSRIAYGGALQQQYQAAFGYLVARLHPHLGDAAGGRRRYVHRRLFRFDGDHRRLFFDLLAVRDQHVDDAHILEAADVGHQNLERIRHGA
jgi:hypothetical protein